MTTEAEHAARLRHAVSGVDAAELLLRVAVPALILEHEPAFKRFVEAVREFLEDDA